jgi:hypothetical protein
MPQADRPDVRAFLAMLNQTPMAELEKLGVEGARSLTTELRIRRPPINHDLPIIRDMSCPGPVAPIPLRYYDARKEREAGPLLVYFHGGGFVLGDLDSHHQICIDIASQVDVPVLSVDYRLAPENPFPAAPDDAEDCEQGGKRSGSRSDFAGVGWRQRGRQPGGSYVFCPGSSSCGSAGSGAILDISNDRQLSSYSIQNSIRERAFPVSGGD